MKYLRFILFYYILITISTLGFSQNNLNSLSKEDNTKNIAETYLKSILGEKFVEDSLEFSKTYQTAIRVAAFEIKNEYSTNDDINTIFVFVDGGKVRIKSTKITRKDVNNYLKGENYNNIFYSSKYAFSLAKKEKFKTGKIAFETTLTGYSHSLSWRIISIYKQKITKGDKDGNFASISSYGEQFLLNVHTKEHVIKPYKSIACH